MTNTVPKINLSKIEFLTKDEQRINSILTFIEEWNNDNSDILIKTSGSTGKPKEFHVKKIYFIESAKLSGSYFHYKENENIVLALSIDTIGGKMQVIRALIFQMNLIVCDNSRNPLLDLNKKVDYISLVPLQIEEIIRNSNEKLSLCKSILIGGAAINASLEENLKKSKLNFFESYGMTETLSHIAIRKIGTEDYFTVLKGVTISLKENCLVITVPNLGIENLETNDIVEIIDDKKFKLIGRKDLVINSGGYKFHPELLEKKIAKKIDIAFFILGEKNEEFGQIITLFVETIFSETELNQLKDIFVENFERFEIPKKIYFVEEFVRTESNKINRFETQKLILEGK